ncbi:hypothetical protein M422DRAFT_222153 [Sphaerobolus stellatus SS14]|nr:hypothetical protein M422DRAFT_222153 [Sphaerobolus stellatus SS14]
MSDQIRATYEAAGQGHVFQFWDKLSTEEQQTLISQLKPIDVDRVNKIFAKAIQNEKEGATSPDGIEPLPANAFDTVVGAPEKEAEWRERGLQAIAAGEVGVLLMAGGQGTRLGSSAPKGCYDIGLPSHKSLFQYQAERIARLQVLAEERVGKEKGSVVIPWYVMTSGPTRPETEQFFVKNNYFGLNSKNVIFFEQGTLPCLTSEGKIILETPSKVGVAPDGNGGLYAALRQPLSIDPSLTVLSDLTRRKVLYIHAYCVDNCLVRVADPVFLGYCIQKQSACAAKVVRKQAPTESVGVVGVRDHRFSVVEYSEISKEQAERRDPSGELAFRAANIVNHFYTTAFLKQIESFEDQMPFHIARKKIPYVDENGQTVKPSKVNGMKLELFVFDVFPFTQDFNVLEVERKEEFSPLKNASGTGSDDPETSRRDLLSQQKRFLIAAGAKVEDGVDIEVSPHVSYAGDGLEAVKGKTFTKSGIAESVEALDALV